jgi:hypothetical protein
MPHRNVAQHRAAWKKSRKYKLCYYRAGARTRGYAWDLTDAEAEAIFAQDCHYCGWEGPGGIDRYFNGRGYTPENAVPCCTGCNNMKGNKDGTAFLDLLRAIVSRHPK